MPGLIWIKSSLMSFSGIVRSSLAVAVARSGSQSKVGSNVGESRPVLALRKSLNFMDLRELPFWFSG
jgi:hypothetical protein